MQVILGYIEGKFNIQFQYDEKLIDIVRQIPYRKYNPRYKMWEVPANEENLEMIKKILEGNCELLISPSIHTWRENREHEQSQIKVYNEALVEKAKSYEFKMKPYAHQQDSFNWLLGKSAGGLFFECGLGKTKTILDVINFYYHEHIIKKVLVICPLSVMDTWIKEIQKHTSLSYTVLYASMTKRKEILATTDTTIYLLNYDAVRLMLDELDKAKFDVLICDESSFLKSHKSLRTRAITMLAKTIKYRYCLTGTPITQSIVSVFPQIRVLSQEVLGNSFYAFRNKYCKMGGYNDKEITGYYNLEDFHKRLASISVTYKKEDCLDLPPKVYETRNYELSAEQKKMYMEMSYFLAAQIKEGIHMTATVVLTKLLRLQQILSAFAVANEQDNKIVRLKDNPKLELLKETLEELSGKTVIWVKFREDVDIICSAISGCVQFEGGMNLKQREQAIEFFNNAPEIKYLVMTSAGGYGLNLQMANNMIFYSHDFSLEKRLQAEDRIHRIGQSKTVTIINLVAKKTFEEHIIECIGSKKDFASYVMNNLSELVEVL